MTELIMQVSLPSRLLLLISIFLLTFNPISSSASSTTDDRRAYIIHMDKSRKPANFATHESWYTSLLSSLPPSSVGALPIHLYTYSHVMHGFSAVLSQSQLEHLARVPGHVVAYPDSYGQLHTTHTPKFLGLSHSAGLWPASDYGDDVIIAILDSGIWPESDSFNDQGMPPVPDKWQGTCETGTEFNSSLCNRKLIGARSFSKGLKQRSINISRTDDYDSPRDFDGHGTHTSSTAAGSPVPRASCFGYAEGTATGIAPKARLAMYKVWFYTDTFDSAATDVLAGMDAAIADGVDVMSLSLGFFKTPYYDDVIAIGAFAAMEKGIFVSCSAGNGGPHAYTIINGAPWLTSVGAGTIDRDYFATVTLGDETKSIRGTSLFPERLLLSNVSLYYGMGNSSKESCGYLALDLKAVNGKVVLCTPNPNATIYDQMYEISRTEAKAAILVNDGAEFLHLDDFSLPFVVVGLREGNVIKKYVTKAARQATVGITFVETELGTKPAPKVAYFSSRGPSRISPWILKPDIMAPGVKVLAAWAPNRGFAPIGDEYDYLLTDYALVSGTSMASPHVIGVAAMLRSLYRDWSTAAIRSAMMTTADIADNTNGTIIDMITGSAASPLDFGGGHVNPNKAMDPGLVYDLGVEDYMDFVCALNYTSQQIGVIARKHNYTCKRASLDLNYPSFMVILNNTNSTNATFKRVLTNVEDQSASYHAVVKAPSGMKVEVEPKLLSFEGKGSKQEFSVKVEIDLEDSVRVESEYMGNYGYLSWYEIGGKHVARSPIVSAFAP